MANRLLPMDPAFRVRPRKPRRRLALERTLEQRACDLAKSHGWYARKMNGLGFSSWPDREFFGRTQACRMPLFLVEFKRRGEKPTPGQWKMIRDLRRRGFQIFVIDRYEDFAKLFHRARAH